MPLWFALGGCAGVLCMLIVFVFMAALRILGYAK
jgi:hypothetical protein